MNLLLEIENGWYIATLRSEEQIEFIRSAMTYVVQRNWTYYIGSSNHNSGFHSDMEVTAFRYCASAHSIDDPGNIIKYFKYCTYIVHPIKYKADKKYL